MADDAPGALAPEPSGKRHTETLFPLLYDDLRGLAAHMMAGKPPGQTLQATALVHEAFLRLSRSNEQAWENRGHFFGAAAEAMRRILIEDARRKQSLRRRGYSRRVNLDDVQLAFDTEPELLLTIDEALEKLRAVEPVKAELVKLRFFTGLSVEEVGHQSLRRPRRGHRSAMER